MKPVWVYPESKEGQKHSGKQGSENQERNSEVKKEKNPQMIVFPKNDAKCGVSLKNRWA